MILLTWMALFFSGAQDSSSPDRLKKAVEEAKTELAAEETRLANEDAAEEAELSRAKELVAKATDELVDRTGSVSRKTKELESLRAERGKLRQARSGAVLIWADLHRTAQDMRQKLSDLLEALPPSESRSAQTKFLEEAKTSLEHPAGEPFDPRPLLAAGRSLLGEASSTATFTHPIHNADGVGEEARVLRAGMIFHAYQGKQSGRVGEVAAAPAGQGGYRWTESLPDWARQDLLRALEGAADSSGKPVLQLPVDVTQRLAPERREAARSLFEILRAGGLVMIPLLGVGLLAFLVTLERAVTLTAKSSGSGREIAAVLELCRKGEFQEAVRCAQAGRGLGLRALASGLAARGRDPAKVEEAVQQSVLREMVALERFLPLLAVLAGIAPMLGLLGTVTGMIKTFDVIRLFGSGDPGIMAGGISEALVATATGLVIAIPILLVHSFVSGRVDRILAETQSYVAALLPLISEPHAQEVS
ncbi:MAG TPA: MotA/TolQ/ExbB proton channel family protein, partial [Planctomycetota bacterium]|nr:MotA/TolQ/ExbB proton channel family protein [Planctomycetota bacterium]